nr:DnaA regulatory inactivator Hda [Stenotrophomonas koreensis]
MPLSLRYPPDQRLQTYLGAPPAALAQLRALAVGAVEDWLYISGTAGTGKTHLALAVCAAAEQAGRRAIYLPLGAARGRVGEALEGLEQHDLIALDGLDLVAGNRDDEIALFDFHNRVRAAGHALLYTGRMLPEGLGLVLPDLRSRLGQCGRISLQPLTEAGRAEVLKARAQRRGLALDGPALEWLLTRTGRDLGSLVSVLDRLDRESLAAKRRLTVPFLRNVLGEAEGNG